MEGLFWGWVINAAAVPPQPGTRAEVGEKNLTSTPQLFAFGYLEAAKVLTVWAGGTWRGAPVPKDGLGVPIGWVQTGPSLRPAPRKAPRRARGPRRI